MNSDLPDDIMDQSQQPSKRPPIGLNKRSNTADNPEREASGQQRSARNFIIKSTRNNSKSKQMKYPPVDDESNNVSQDEGASRTQEKKPPIKHHGLPLAPQRQSSFLDQPT